MGAFLSIEELREKLDFGLLNCGTELVNLTECEFNFQNTTLPEVSVKGTNYVLKSNWVTTQLCRLLGVSSKFWNRNPDELSEEILKTHIGMFEESESEVVFLYKQEGPDCVLRGVVPNDYFVFSTGELLTVMEEFIGTENIDSVFFIDGADPYAQKTAQIVLTKDTRDLAGAPHNVGYLLISSEVGGTDLNIQPVLFDKKTSFFYPLLREGKVFSKIKYTNPENGTLIPVINKTLSSVEDMLESVIDDLNEYLLSEMKYEDMLKASNDWGTRRGFSVALSKKLSSNLTAVVKVDEDDEEEDGVTFETANQFIQTAFETGMSDKFESFFKVASFISERTGFNYTIG